MKRLLAAVLILCLSLPLFPVQAKSAVPAVTFSKKSDKVTGGKSYTFVLQADQAFASDTEVSISCTQTGKSYTAVFAAGQKSAKVSVPQKEATKKAVLTYTIQASSKGLYSVPKGTKLTLTVMARPLVRFVLDANIGFVGKKMTVPVVCGNRSSVQPGGVYELRDQTGRLYAQKEWTNLANRLVFSFDVKTGMEGGKYFSVWKDGVRVSNVGEGYGAISDPSRKVVQKVATKDPYMSLTIDCGYADRKTDKVLAVLDKYNVKCTFFITGYFVTHFPNSVKKIYEHGHEIGQHTLSHPRMTKQSVKEQIKQLQKPSKMLQDLVGVYPRLYRPPFGDHDQNVTALARGEGQEVIMWTIDSHDWDEKFKNNPDAVIARDKKNVGPGTIVLHHMDGFHVDEILDVIIPYYQKKLGLTLVPVSELMQHGGLELPPMREADTLTKLPKDAK